jgi:XTP/dITP diphosphohydrolase
LRGKQRPWSAKFRCVIALATPDGLVRLAEGICPGEIIAGERGQNGFGYDPIFLIPVLGKTMAELELNEKNRISHRARAVMAAKQRLVEMVAKFS